MKQTKTKLIIITTRSHFNSHLRLKSTTAAKPTLAAAVQNPLKSSMKFSEFSLAQGCHVARL